MGRWSKAQREERSHVPDYRTNPPQPPFLKGGLGGICSSAGVIAEPHVNGGDLGGRAATLTLTARADTRQRLMGSTIRIAMTGAPMPPRGHPPVSAGKGPQGVTMHIRSDGGLALRQLCPSHHTHSYYVSRRST